MSDIHSIVPVVRIRTEPSKGNPDGILEINKSDFDPAKHQLVDDGEQPSLDLTKAEAAKPDEATADQTAGPFANK